MAQKIELNKNGIPKVCDDCIYLSVEHCEGYYHHSECDLCLFLPLKKGTCKRKKNYQLFTDDAPIEEFINEM